MSSNFDYFFYKRNVFLFYNISYFKFLLHIIIKKNTIIFLLCCYSLLMQWNKCISVIIYGGSSSGRGSMNIGICCI